ncbi:hypothetical protein PO909_012806 [Leuciscus waleckii]
MLFTLLAVIVAAVVLGRNKGPVPSKCTHQTSAAAVVEERAGPEPGASSQYHPETHCNETRQQLQSGAKILKAKDETLKHEKDSNSDNEEEVYAENKPLKYMAGMLRTCQLEKMMTKEELEEEQRVQQEQLAAIFQLLRDKQDTFGDVTEGDLQDQLKLYSI